MQLCSAAASYDSRAQCFVKTAAKSNSVSVHVCRRQVRGIGPCLRATRCSWKEIRSYMWEGCTCTSSSKTPTSPFATPRWACMISMVMSHLCLLSIAWRAFWACSHQHPDCSKYSRHTQYVSADTHTQYVSADTHTVRVRQAVTCYLTAAPVARMQGATNHAQMPRFLFQYAHVPTLQYLLAVQRFCLYVAHFVDTILAAAAAAAAAAVHYLYSGHMCSLHRPSHFPSINLLRPNISCSCFISSMS